MQSEEPTAAYGQISSVEEHVKREGCGAWDSGLSVWTRTDWDYPKEKEWLGRCTTYGESAFVRSCPAPCPCVVCDEPCKQAPSNWICTSSVDGCQYLPGGKYLTKDDCEKTCTMYTCANGKCTQDNQHGEYPSLSDCQKNCKGPTPGGQCKNFTPEVARGASPNNIYDCPDTSNYYVDKRITFEKIAQGWVDTGMNKDVCPYFLRLVAGECQQASLPGTCSYVGGSGIMQLDEITKFYPGLACGSDKKAGFSGKTCTIDLEVGDSNEVDVNNPCTAAHLAMSNWVTDSYWPDKWKPNGKAEKDCTGAGAGCWGKNGRAVGGFYNNSCFPPSPTQPTKRAVSVSLDTPTQDWQLSGYGKPTNCNFIGPFCHRGTNKAPCEEKNNESDCNDKFACRWDTSSKKCYPTGKIWNGGGNGCCGDGCNPPLREGCCADKYLECIKKSTKGECVTLSTCSWDDGDGVCLQKPGGALLCQAPFTCYSDFNFLHNQTEQNKTKYGLNYKGLEISKECWFSQVVGGAVCSADECGKMETKAMEVAKAMCKSISPQ